METEMRICAYRYNKKCPNESRCINSKECGKKEDCTRCANFIMSNIGYCLHHGLTKFYKNGKCKLCVQYQRLETLYKNKDKKEMNEKTLKV